MGDSDRFHDVFFITSAKKFYFVNENRGITLTNTHIKWTFDGRPDEASLTNIVSVRLVTAGDWRNAVAQCQITFADGYFLTASNGSSSGLPSDKQTLPYQEFVRDLHRRLIAAGRDTITFTAGYRPLNYYIVLVCAILLGTMAVPLPLILLLLTGELAALWVLIGGAFLIWPLVRMVRNNAPSTYDPRDLPEELLS